MKKIIEIKEEVQVGKIILEKGDRIVVENKENIFYFSMREAEKYAKKVQELLEKIVGNYTYVSLNISDSSEDGGKGITFELMYGNELIYNLDIVTTYKNLKNNDNFRVKDRKDEDYLFLLIER